MVEINLLPKEYKSQAQPSVWKYASWAVAGLTAAVLGGWFLSVNGNTNRLRQQSADLQQQIDALVPQKRRFEELSATKNQLEQVTNVALQLRDQKAYWSNDLASFVERLPGNVVFSKIDMNKAQAPSDGSGAVTYGGKAVTREISLTGKARSQESVVNFLNAYEDDQNFGVDFQSMQRDAKTGDYTFNAKVGVVGDVPTASTETAPVAPGTTPASPAAPAAPAAAPAAPASGGNP